MRVNLLFSHNFTSHAMKGITVTQFAEKFGFDKAGTGEILGVSIDSRTVKQGELFFALKGERVDSHQFLEEVAQKGVVAAVVSKEYQGSDFGLPLFAVDDVVRFLQDLAHTVLLQRSCKVIGVTGSVGKTTTKEFIATLLDGSFSIAKNPGSSNSRVTLPTTILNSDGSEEILILEMGMSQPGEMKRLVEIAPPDLAVLTKVGRAHAQFFPDGVDGIAYEKGEIIAHPKTKQAIVHHEAMQFDVVRDRGACQKTVYGKEGSDYFLQRDEGAVWVEERGLLSPRFTLPFTADHLSANFLAAVAVARTLEVGWEEIIARAATLTPFSRRFEIIVKEGVTYVNDCYNASAESTKAALKNLPKARGKTIFVFGEMRELGRYSEESHQEVGEAALDRVDHLLCIGEGCQPTMELFRRANKPVETFTSLATLKETLVVLAAEGDVVLIKGANSLQLWRILE